MALMINSPRFSARVRAGTLLWTLLLAVAAPAAAAEPRPPAILLLHSYHKGMLWTDAISRGFSEVLAQRAPEAAVYEEYMDTKRHDEPAYLQQLYDLYRFKYAGGPLDAVVTSDDNAFRFALAHRDDLFPGTPLVFCGVNNLAVYHREVNHRMRNLTGVVEAFDIRATLETALRLQPETQVVYIINDRTTTGHSNRGLLAQLVDSYASRVTFEWLEDLSMPSLLETIGHLPEKSLILLMSFNRDAAGRVFSYRDSIRLIGSRANRPIYGVWGFYLGRGIVGGILTSGVSQGRTAAELVVRILDGQAAETIPIVATSPNQAMFDYRQLQRFGIATDRLPPGSIITHRPFSFYRRYKHYLWAGAAVLTLQLVVILFLVLNIRKRHQAEERLSQSKTRYQQIFENIQDAYYEVDMDGVVIEASPSIAKVLRYPRQAFIGRQIQTLYTNPADRRPVLDLIMAQGRIVDHELKLLNADGAPVDIAISAQVISDAEGHPMKIVGSLRDISRRKNAEAQRRLLQQELERAKRMEALGLLAGGVAHDLNNILSGIVTYPELLLLDQQLSPKTREAIATIQKSGQRAAAVVQDLITISRGFAGHRQPLDLNAVVEEFMASAECQAIQQRYPAGRLESSLAADLPTTHGSKVHIMKALMNLVINGFEAIDGTGRGGRLRIATRLRSVAHPLHGYETIQPGDYVLLTVEDDGGGIPPEDIEHIFEPFYSKKILGRSGTGLGLTVVWNTLQDHGGHIDVASSQGGTAFMLYFPASREAPVAMGTPDRRPIRKGRGQTILIVDDEPLQRQIAVQLLQRLGYRAATAASGEAAVDHVRRQPVDMVLLDMLMPPGINGCETYIRMARIRPDLKAVITSGFSDNEDVQKAQAAGAGAFLPKPYSLEALAEAVFTTLNPDDRDS